MTVCNKYPNDKSRIDESLGTITIGLDQLQISNHQRYVNQGKFAEGGLGQVFLANDTEFQRNVVVKEIKSEYANDAEYQMRFQREAQIMASLQHPGIPPIYSMGLNEQRLPFYSMKLIGGQTLKDAVRKYHESTNAPQRPSSDKRLRELLRHFGQVCLTIDYAHHQGAIHRDLTPANIMIGEFGETYVIDWGLAKLVNDSQSDFYTKLTGKSKSESIIEDINLTHEGQLFGTPSFLPPEQANGSKSITEKTDIFALGAILYFVLTGRAPYSSHADMGDISAGKYPDLREVNAAIPADLQSICRRAMAVDPEQRHLSANELAEDLEQWLSGSQVASHQYSRSEYASIWLRQHPKTKVAGTVFGLLALFVLLPMVVVLFQKNEHLLSENELNKGLLSFVNEDLLSQSDPQQQANPNITLRQALLNSVTKSSERFADRPLVVAEINEAAIDPLTSMGEFVAALPLAKEALEIRRKYLSNQNRRTRNSAQQLGTAYYGNQQLDQAEKWFTWALELAEKNPAQNALEIAKLLNNLALIAEDRNQPAEAESLYLRAENFLAKVPPDEAEESHRLVANYASFLFNNGKFHEAEIEYANVIQSLSDEMEENHPDRLTILNNLGLVKTNLKKFNEAEALLKSVLAKRESRLGFAHQNTIESSINLAVLYHKSNQHAHLIEQLQDAQHRLNENTSKTDSIVALKAIVEKQLAVMTTDE